MSLRYLLFYSILLQKNSPVILFSTFFSKQFRCPPDIFRRNFRIRRRGALPSALSPAEVSRGLPFQKEFRDIACHKKAGFIRLFGFFLITSESCAEAALETRALKRKRTYTKAILHCPPSPVFSSGFFRQFHYIHIFLPISSNLKISDSLYTFLRKIVSFAILTSI